MTPTLYLASQSPRRAELLTQIGVVFERLRVDVPEIHDASESPKAYVTRLAQEKALAGVREKPEGVVLGADTIGECAGQVLEKPKDAAHAASMLAMLSGRQHYVHTAIAVASQGRIEHVCVTSEVTFREITPDEAAAYWLTGEPADKAGGYGIQGLGGVFVSHLAGSYSGVMGLPIAQTQQLLTAFGIPCWQPPS